MWAKRLDDIEWTTLRLWITPQIEDTWVTRSLKEVSLNANRILAETEDWKAWKYNINTWEFTTLPFNFDDLRIVNQSWIELELPEFILEKLRIYLQNLTSFEEVEKNWLIIDWLKFLAYLYWIPFEKRFNITEKFNLSQMGKTSQPNAWEIVLLDSNWIAYQEDGDYDSWRQVNTSWESSNYNFAMYLWEWLYITKIAWRNIIITSMQELAKFYAPSRIYILSPKMQSKAS